METNVESKESSHSHSHSSEESPRVVGEEHNPAIDITTLLSEPHVNGLLDEILPDDDCPRDDEDECLVEPPPPPSGGGTVEIADDVNTNENLRDNSGRNTDKNQSDSKSLETKVIVEKGEEMKNGVVTGMESPTVSGTQEEGEEELNSEQLTTMELPLDNDKKEEAVNEGVIKMELLPENETREEELNDIVTGTERMTGNEVTEELLRPELDVGQDEVEVTTPKKSFLLEPNAAGGDESGTEEEQVAFMKELETFHKERCLEFKPPRFYGEPLNCLKLWRAVIRLGGYEQVTSCKLWRQVGESFKPPKTCTTVSWTFRCFYEKAILEYEKHKMRIGELPFTDASFAEPAATGNQASLNQASGSGRARRDAAARAMQGWHSQRLLGNGEVGDPIIKDKNSGSMPKREKQFKSIGLLKRKKPSPVERAVKVARMKATKPQLDTMVVDIGPPADWVKINVQRTKDCFEVYALVPGLLREEVRVQSDPAGRLVISGQPEQLDNPWGVTPFKKVVSLPSRIDPHQTSAVVTLHGQLFVRVPFEQSDL